MSTEKAPTKRGGKREGAGRPTADPELKSITRSITMPKSTWAELDNLCAEEKLTASTWFRLKVEAERMRRKNQPGH